MGTKRLRQMDKQTGLVGVKITNQTFLEYHQSQTFHSAVTLILEGKLEGKMLTRVDELALKYTDGKFNIKQERTKTKIDPMSGIHCTLFEREAFTFARSPRRCFWIVFAPQQDTTFLKYFGTLTACRPTKQIAYTLPLLI